MKKLIKFLIPSSIWNYIKTIKIYNYDMLRYIEHSNSFEKFNTQSKVIAKIIYKYHVIEKGLTMPKRRKAFGFKLITGLIDDCNFYIEKEYDKNNMQFKHAIHVLNEYLDIHNEGEVDNILVNKIKIYLFDYNNKYKQHSFTVKL